MRCRDAIFRGKNIPDSSLLTPPDNAFIASRLIHDAEPLDTFLTKAFLPPDVSLAQAKQAAVRVKSAAAGSGAQPDELAADHALLARINDPVNLRSGKQALIDILRHSGLDGLFSSLLARLTLGEASDLGPDNMLVIPGEDARHKVISIDVTGFRYDREKGYSGKFTGAASAWLGRRHPAPCTGTAGAA